MKVLSLFDKTGIAVQPWAEAGYECICVDIQHEGIKTVGNITYVGADILTYIPPIGEYAFGFAFPPCDHMSVSGARWFKGKGLGKLALSIQLVSRAAELMDWIQAPHMIENPVSTLSTYWRKPDYTFHPCHFGGYIDGGDAYTKKTCVWTGGGLCYA